MKKRINYLLIIFMMVTIIPLATYIFMDTSDSNLNNNKIAMAENDYNEQIKAYENSLIETYGDNYKSILSKKIKSTELAQKIESDFEKNEFGENKYPDNFGGMFIDSNGDLVVNIKRTDTLSKNLMYESSMKKNNLNENENVITNMVDYSYYELENINNEITKYFSGGIVSYDNFVANYIDEFSNRVTVELKDISVEKQNEFKKEVVDSEVIDFKEGERVSTTATYKTGSQISTTYTIKKGNTTTMSGGNCSIGFKAKRNGTLGYVTAGHCFGFMDYTVSSATSSYGTYQTRVYNSSMDAAFVALSSGNSVSNDLATTGYQASFINTTGSTYFVSGTPVGKVGYVTKYTHGSVTSLDYSVTDDEGYYHTGLVKTNQPIQKGDSGGPVFVISSLSLKNGAQLIGIGTLGNNSLTGFYKYDSVVSSLGLTKY